MVNTTIKELGRALSERKPFQVAELVAPFVVAGMVIIGAAPLAGENPLARQGVVWAANVVMLVLVWLGLRLRGQGWDHFGLSLRFAGWRRVGRALLLSLIVSVAAVVASVVGVVVMANIVGRPEPADLGGYNFLRGNLPMLILSLAGVYVVSSFGEEVIYRGFLINRMAELGSGGKAAWRLGVVVSSVVFGLVHFEWGLAGMVQTGLMGLALAISYLAVRRNLWVTVLAHGYLDTVLLLQVYFAAVPG